LLAKTDHEVRADLDRGALPQEETLTQTTYTLTSFIEPDPDDAEVPHRYLAGFRDVDGEPWGVIVRLEGEQVRRLARRRAWHVTVHRIDGTLQPEPGFCDTDEEEYGALFKSAIGCGYGGF